MLRLILLIASICTLCSAQQPVTINVPANKPIIISVSRPALAPGQESTNKSVVRWSVDKPLDFSYIPLENNTLLHCWAGTGLYNVTASITTIVVDWEKREFDFTVTDQKFLVTVGQPLPPGPTPPGPGPQPPTPSEDDSVNSNGPIVLFLKEAENFSPSENELQILNSTRIKQYLNEKTYREPGGFIGWRQWDDDYTDAQLSGNAKFWTNAYRKALAKAGDKRPWLFISTPLRSFNYDISDKTEQQVLDIIKSHIP